MLFDAFRGSLSDLVNRQQLCVKLDWYGAEVVSIVARSGCTAITYQLMTGPLIFESVLSSMVVVSDISKVNIGVSKLVQCPVVPQSQQLKHSEMKSPGSGTICSKQCLCYGSH